MSTPKLRFRDFTDGWEQRKFSDIAETRRGLTYKPTDVSEDGVRVLRSSNIDEELFEVHADDVFVNTNAVNIPYTKNGDILITSANGSNRLVGKHTIVRGIEEESTVHGGFMLIASSDEPEFVNASMSSAWYTNFIKVFVAGGNGAIGNLNKKDLDEQDVLVPCREERDRIGLFFSNLNNLITLHQRKLVKLNYLKKAYLSEMFPAPGERKPRRRFAGFTSDWEQRKLDKLCIFEKGRGLNKDDLNDNGKYPCILYGELFTKYGMFIDSVISKTDNVQAEYKRSEIGDILIPRCDTTPDGLGRATSLSLENVILGFDINILKIKDRSNLDSEFVSVALNRHRKNLLEKVVGNMVRHLENKEIKEVVIEYPHSIDEQKKIARAFHQLEHLITLHQRKLDKLRLLKQAYIAEMFV